MSKRAGVADRLRELSDKLDLVIKRLSYLEDIISKSPEYEALRRLMGLLRLSAEVQEEPIKVFRRFMLLEEYLKKPLIKDEISRFIIQIIALKGPLNISQIERELRARRGRASRRIIRARLKKLAEAGLLREGRGWGHVYELAE